MGYRRYSVIYSICIIIVSFNSFTANAQDVHLTASHNGIACESQPNRPSQSIPIDTMKCAVAAPYENPFSIKCETKPPLSSNRTVAWYKVVGNDKNDPGRFVEKNDRMSISSDSSYSELKFTTLSPDDTGKYHCRVVTKGQENDSRAPFVAVQIIELRVLPWVKTANKEITAIEESAINLTCIVYSNISSVVTWQVNNTEGSRQYNESKDRVKLNAFNGTKNANLVIESANATIDRGFYVCSAESPYGRSNISASIYVRVKSKYAALWPFLGICAEVIILCTVILIYEKKRDKTELEESDTDQGPETKSSPDHGQDNVRYRK